MQLLIAASSASSARQACVGCAQIIVPEPQAMCMQGLRPGAVILMGKNTMMKRSIRLHCETTGNDKWSCILDEVHTPAVQTQAGIMPCMPAHAANLCACSWWAMLASSSPTGT